MAKRRKETQIGRRLNDVRQTVGAKDLKAFYASLKGERIRGFPSYPAVCTYHSDPWRDPPTVYLSRIIERYPQISLEWLVAGRGQKIRDEWQVPDHRLRLIDAFTSELGGYPLEDSNASLLALEGTVARFLNERVLRGDAFSPAERESAEVEVAARIGRAGHAALTELGMPDSFHDDEGTSFLVLFCLAAREWADAAERCRRGETINE